MLVAVSDALPHDLDAMADADGYNAWLIERARPWVRGRVLDAGAGIGTHTTRLAGLADALVALEPDPELTPLLRARAPGVRVVEGDAHAVDGSFDTIVCFNVLEHFTDDEGALRRFRELLAPGGTLVAVVPAHPRLYGTLDRAFGHERRYTRDELRAKVEAAGLRVERLRHVNPLRAVGWLLHARLLRRDHLPRVGLSLYDRLVPLLRAADAVPVPVGLSLWVVAKTTGSASASAANA
jgi:SAM-dependent methyltransferase